MAIKKVEVFSSDRNIIIIDGMKYMLETEKTKKIDGVIHGDRVVFKKINEKEYKKDLEVVVDALSKRTNTKELLRDMVKRTEYGYLRRLARRIRSGKPIKKQRGCMGFKIGDGYLELLD